MTQGIAAAADAVTISDQGLLLRGAGREPLLLTFDGRYIWAFSPARDGRPQGSGILVEWGWLVVVVCAVKSAQHLRWRTPLSE